ncbi:MAG: hypothetical protein WBF17_11285 [Phycisphaerae bacterium]
MIDTSRAVRMLRRMAGATSKPISASPRRHFSTDPFHISTVAP